MARKGVGPTLYPQIMAEIGDVHHFSHGGTWTTFTGVNSGVKPIQHL
ncbi:transposase [Enterococcus faecium]|nr:IS110 family transposase [Enterococcus faecium]